MPRIGPESGSEVWVGRQRELSVVQTAVSRLAQGAGSVLRLVGEPGIGKSALLTVATQEATDSGYQVFGVVADQLSQQSSLSVLLTCLGVRQGADDPWRAEIAQTLHGQPPLFPATGSTLAAVAEMLVCLVEELCATAPTVLIVDDAHWMDEPSTVVWRRLAANAEHLPLLLVTAHNQDPSRPTRPPAGGGRRHEHVLRLAPLDESEVSALLTRLLGAPPGATLTRWSGAAVGNPLYLRELADVLLREDLIQVVAGQADLRDGGVDRVPPALTDALTSRLGLVPDAGDALRTAALLGTEFTVTDLGVVLGRPVRALADELQSAVAARILTGSGERMTFCHPLIRQALHDTIPLSLRRALHLDLARELAAAATDPLTVAQQLLSAGGVENRWVPDWLQTSVSSLAAVDPALAVCLLEMQLGQLPTEDPRRAPLAVALARSLHVLGRWEEAVERAREAVGVATGPDEYCEMHWLLIRALNQSGKTDEAELILRQVLARREMPELWRGRLLATLALIRRTGVGGPAEAEALAGDALVAGERSADAYAIAYASIVLSLTHSDRGDHPAALRCAEQAIAALVGYSDHPDLEMFALHCRMVSLQNLARWSEAETVMRQSRKTRRRARYVAAAATGATEAVLLYWWGRWDEALTALTPVADDPSSPSYAGLHQGGPALLWRGVAALIAVRRDERALAEEHLQAGTDRAADAYDLDFLLAARALYAEQQGEPEQGVAILAEMLHRDDSGSTPTHHWLADLIRAALACGDLSTVAAALDRARAQDEAERGPGRAATLLARCVGLATDDPEPLRTAVQHYRSAGPRTELAATLEDLAVVLAGHGADTECRVAAREAVGLYTRINAPWDIRRTEARLRSRGVRRGVSGPREPRPVSGWAALTATERRIAVLVAEGRSTPEIAAAMFLTRRTVQTHVSRALHKLGLRSRNQIAGEVLRTTGRQTGSGDR
ncbi:AAA family ATPase [Micromonospora sp. NPDC000207]|uniref:ATP-binding protein n=1 Tax=Micromonospora sp. NPDC000207 TaxID=3154246 RepID=UPI00331D51AE